MTDETIVTSIEKLKEEGEKSPYLTFLAGPRIGEIFALTKEETIVGRSPDCDLYIEDKAISRKHFRVLLKDEILEIEDLKSTNGTYLNGVTVKRALLDEGDKIQISKGTLLEVTYLDQTRSLSEKKRYEMGVIDPITNTFNKRYFLDRLKEEFSVAQRKNHLLSLILLDLDHFKNVNDTYGHLAGDLVLQKMCAEISKTIRIGDTFARYGGEEFVIIMRDADCKNAVDLAERVRALVSQTTIAYEESQIKITISCGVACLNSEMKDPMALIALADKNLYKSKQNGRNCVTV